MSPHSTAEPRREDLTPGVFLIHDALTDRACREHIAWSEEHGYHEATVDGSRGPTMEKSVRNNDRVIRDDFDLADALWERVGPAIPERWRSVEGRVFGRPAPFEVCGLNERFRYYRYEPGHFFKPHYDGHYRRDNGEVSMLTLLVYLNEDCGGGQTRIIPAGGSSREIAPKRGLALLFQHRLLHEGSPVTEGRKYVLRTDVMYRPLRD